MRDYNSNQKLSQEKVHNAFEKENTKYNCEDFKYNVKPNESNEKNTNPSVEQRTLSKKYTNSAGQKNIKFLNSVYNKSYEKHINYPSCNPSPNIDQNNSIEEDIRRSKVNIL